jgi:signal transduction histidine kinase
VVLNLVTNASEALGPEGGIISIAMSLTRVTQESRADAGPITPVGDYLKLEISDTGGGMAEDVRARIFDPFFTTKFTGRGLGLAVVQGIVHSHGGAIHGGERTRPGHTF